VPVAPIEAPPSDLELWLLKYLFAAPTLSHFAALHLDPDWIRHSGVRRIVGLSLVSPGDVAGLLSRLEDDEFARTLVSSAASERRALPNPEVGLADTVMRLRNLRLDERMAEVNQNLADPALEDSERLALIQETLRLRVAKRSPLTPLGNPDP
jgi:hypothetical protein